MSAEVHLRASSFPLRASEDKSPLWCTTSAYHGLGSPPSRLRRYGGHSFALLVLALRSSRLRAARFGGQARCTHASEGVRKGGVEPPKPFGYRILSPARLPVPPLSRIHGPLSVTRLSGAGRANSPPYQFTNSPI